MKPLEVCVGVWIVCCAAVLTAQSPTKSDPQAQAQTAEVAGQAKVYKPGGGVSSPKLIHSVDPSYTSEARRKKLYGLVILSIVVDTDGKPRDIQVTRSLAEEYTPELRSTAEELDRSAVKAVGKYRFQPSMLNGKAVPVSIRVEITFHLS